MCGPIYELSGKMIDKPPGLSTCPAVLAFYQVERDPVAVQHLHEEQRVPEPEVQEAVGIGGDLACRVHTRGGTGVALGAGPHFFPSALDVDADLAWKVREVEELLSLTPLKQAWL